MEFRGKKCELVTRYAPSPTGYLHLGHVAHIVYVWGLAEVLGASVQLRIEDHDRRRCRRAYEAAIYDDLEWLGFEPANVVTPNFRQSESAVAYNDAIARIHRSHHVYRCICTRKDLAVHSTKNAAGEFIYSGHCRDANHPANTLHGLRLEWGRGEEAFNDVLLGAQTQKPVEQCGDMLLKDRHQQWTYQFAVTVDDIRHGVNLVIRGEDLLDSTGRQIRLARQLGRAEPAQFCHHPLITDPEGVKLSKKQRSPAIRDLRDSDVSAAAVIGEAANAVGLLSDARPLERPEIAQLVAARHGLA